MTLFPQLNESYYVDNDHDILKLMDHTYSKNIQINQSFWSEADIDSRFKAGDQTLWNDIYGNLPSFRKRSFNFNRIRRTINMISGYQRQHRKSTICTPVEDASQLTADQFTKMLFHSNTNAHILETISEAFEGCITTGMNLLSIWMDYRRDPVNGDINVDNVSYNGYLIDPYFKKMDLSDCNSLWTRKYVSREQAKALLPGRSDDIQGMRGSGNRDGKFQFMPEAYNYGMQDLLIYDEFWYLSCRKQKMLCDIESGETIEWRGSDDDLKDFLKSYPKIMPIDHDIPTVKLAIVVQGKVMYHGANPLGIDKYPFVPVWAYYDPQIPYFPWRIQGVVRGLRDAQYLYNRRRGIELDILESQINSGWKYKENALVNPKDIFLEGQGRGLAIKGTAQMTDVEKIQPAQVPPSMIQLSELLGAEIQQISGVNEELLGSASDDKAGILSMLRQGAGLTTLQVLFDNLDYAQKLLGSLQMDLMQANWTPGKVRKIVKEDPTPEFYNRAFGKYNAVVEEGLNTSTQRQLEFAQLLTLREVGVPVPSEILIKTSTLTNKNDLVEAIAKAEQSQQQSQQQQSMAQIELLKAQIEDLKGKAMASKGLGMERASRIQENRALAVEKLAEAQHQRDLGTLERIKAAKELTDIDLSQLQKLLDILSTVQAGQHQDQDMSEQKEMIKSAAETQSLAPPQQEAPMQPQAQDMPQQEQMMQPGLGQ